MSLAELTTLVRRTREAAEAREAARAAAQAAADREAIGDVVAEGVRHNGRNQHTTSAARVNPFHGRRES